MGVNAVIAGLCALTLGATCWLAASMPRTDTDRVAELEKRLAAAEKRADAVDEVRGRLREIESKLDRRLAEVSRRVEAASPASRAADGGATTSSAADASGDGSAPAKPLDELVADRVEQRMTEKLDAIAARNRERGADGKWKAPLDALSKELTLTQAQRAEAKRIFDHARDEAYVLLKTARLDGGSLLDDYVEALKSGGDPAATTRQLFQRILAEKVPGSDRTYLTEFVAMSQDVEDQLSRQFDEEQMKRLKSLSVSLLEVGTGYDPVGDYVRARLQ